MSDGVKRKAVAKNPTSDSAAALASMEKARRLLEACAIQTLPVNLALLARHQGICRIREMDTRLDGQLLELESGGYEVILSKRSSRARKRFTLAHEIAHVLLSEESDADGLSCGAAGVEELCNVAAAEMLIPSGFLRGLFSGPEEVAAQSFLEVARRFQCSLEAAGWKLLNSDLVRGALLIWRAGQEVLELTAMPYTRGLKLPYRKGMVVRPGEAEWEKLFADERAWPVREHLLVGKTLLTFVRLGSRSPRPRAGPAKPAVRGHARQGTLPF